MARFLRALEADRWRVRPDRAVAGWLAGHGQSDAVIMRLWRPLCIAALNTPLSEASAQVFANVLRDSLGAGSAASMLWLPRSDLSALLPDAVERFVSAHGGAVRRGTRVETIGPAERGFRLGPGLGDFDAIVYAAPPAQLGRVASAFAPVLSDALDAIQGFAYQPICTVYLKYDVDVPLPRGFTALLDDAAQRAYGQWAFDRGLHDPANRGVVAVVVSASGAHDDEPLSALCEAVARQLRANWGCRSRARRARSSRSGRRWPRARGCGGRRR